jgi:hypothetical protein
LLFPVVTNQPTDRVDPAGDCRLRNDPSAPHRRQQIVLADDPITVADKEDKEIEYLRLDRQQRRPPAELAPVCVERITFE